MSVTSIYAIFFLLALRWLFGDEFDVLTVARHLPPAVSGMISLSG